MTDTERTLLKRRHYEIERAEVVLQELDNVRDGIAELQENRDKIISGEFSSKDACNALWSTVFHSYNKLESYREV